jgi:hypothetical protein
LTDRECGHGEMSIEKIYLGLVAKVFDFKSLEWTKYTVIITGLKGKIDPVLN